MGVVPEQTELARGAAAITLLCSVLEQEAPIDMECPLWGVSPSLFEQLEYTATNNNLATQGPQQFSAT